MAQLLLKQLLPAMPVINTDRLLENSKSIRIIGSVVGGIHITYKLLRYIAMAGNSKNPVLKFLHEKLRWYLNCGMLIRTEFGMVLPWQYIWLHSGNYAVVNYGSYGTVPNAVMEHNLNIQKEMEAGPDKFFRTVLNNKYASSLQRVALNVGCDVENLVFVDNITEGISCALRSFLSDFGDDDGVLCTNLAYSAVLKSIRINTDLQDVKMYQLDFNFPIRTEDEVVEEFENMLQSHKNIKMVIFDHITSASAVVLPIKKLGDLCRKYEVISVVDGAHAPGQMYLQVESYGVDVYIGNLHKWYYTPKSCAIMYIDPKYHDTMQPSLVSHNCYGDLHARFRKQGTRNYAAHITAGFAVEYMEKIGGISFLQSYITPLVEFAVELFTRTWNTTELEIPDNMKAPYMRIVFLPDIFNEVYGTTQKDGDQLVVDLIERDNVVMIITVVGGRLATRVSGQIFSTKSEYVYVANFIKTHAQELEKRQ